MGEEEASLTMGTKQGGGSKLLRRATVLLCASNIGISYCDRVNIAVAAVVMSSEYHWSHIDQATVLAAFFYGYVGSQILGSVLSARCGGRRILFWATVIWSLATLLTPEAAEVGMPVLVGFRVVLGLAEGLAFPSIYHIFAESGPDERSRNIGAVHTGGFVGTIVAFYVSEALVHSTSWASVFRLFGALGLGWALVWATHVRWRTVMCAAMPCSRAGGHHLPYRGVQAATSEGATATEAAKPLSGAHPAMVTSPSHALHTEATRVLATPEKYTATSARTEGMAVSAVPPPPAADTMAPTLRGSAAEPAHRYHHQQQQHKHQPEPHRRQQYQHMGVVLDITKGATYRLAWRMLSHPYVVPILIGHFCHASSHFIALSWLPTYYHEVSADATSSKAAVVAGPYACMAIFSVLAAQAADALLKRGVNRTTVRRLMGGGGYGLAVLFMLLFLGTDFSWARLKAFWLTMALGCSAITAAGHEANKLDVAPPELAGFLQGLSNTLAAFGGVVGVPLAAHLYEQYHTWASVFGMLACIYAVGALTATFFARAERIPLAELM